jgi:hypothetical protein
MGIGSISPAMALVTKPAAKPHQADAVPTFLVDAVRLAIDRQRNC